MNTTSYYSEKQPLTLDNNKLLNPTKIVDPRKEKDSFPFAPSSLISPVSAGNTAELVANIHNSVASVSAAFEEPGQTAENFELTFEKISDK